MIQLPPNDPIFIHAEQDQGILPGDDGESYLDVEQSGGVAPGATVKFVIGTPTFLVDGISNSIEYIVENNVANIMSVSYGDCEANEGASGNAFNAQCSSRPQRKVSVFSSRLATTPQLVATTRITPMKTWAMPPVASLPHPTASA